MVTSAKYPMSQRYSEIMENGNVTEVVYCCDHGRERSPAAAEAAQDRGETATMMRDGMWGLLKRADYNTVKVVELLKKHYSGKFLRLIIDGNSHPGGFPHWAQEAGIAFEKVPLCDIKAEAEAAGQNWREYYY